MPELPELQAHAERLTEGWGGNVLAQVHAAVVHRDEDCRAAGRRTRSAISSCRWAGAASTCSSTSKRSRSSVHLMQGGRLKPDPKQAAKVRGGIARWVFDDRSALMLTEAGKEHRAGVWVPTPSCATRRPRARGRSVDPPSSPGSSASTRCELHGFLRDQGCIAGLGRRLANEVCHRAKLSPFASTSKLGEEGAAAVVAAIRESVDESLAYERTRPDMSSSADRPGGVHHRTGQPCPVCGDTVREVAYSAYTVNYCPTCQTGGKVLADNTTSKFLK